MTKSDSRTKELQRRLTRLGRLAGQLVCCADGAWLIQPEYVRAPRPLVEALRSGGELTEPLLRRGLQLRKTPRPLLPRWLAIAQRDLRALENDPDALAHTQAAARRFLS